MHLNVNPITIILFYQCMTIWTIKYVTGYSSDFNDAESSKSKESLYHSSNPFVNLREDDDSSEETKADYADNKARSLIHQLKLEKYYYPEDCQIMMPEKDDKMPIPFYTHTKPPKVITPDRNGILNIKHETYFKFSCIRNEFLWPYQPDTREILVKCLNSNLIEFKNETHFFEEFKCVSLPIPKLVRTGKTCQDINHTSVLRVGFQTDSTFLNLYRICFDTKLYNPLYAWYQLKTPKYLEVQSTTSTKKIETLTTFFRSACFDNITVPDLYKNQANSMIKTMISAKLTKFYMVEKEGEVRFFVPGHLIHPTEFSYYVQQQATYFYENTIPIWYKFQWGMYKRINEAVSVWLARKPSRKYLVVSGTYSTFALHNEKFQLRRLYLKLPNSVRVPKFYWKMVYDYNTRRGLVFVALNTAFKTYIKEKRMCKSSMCPGFTSHNEFVNAFIYCCSKSSFEKIYGRLDSFVYKTM